MAEYKLTYFNLRAVAEPIRMIFALAKVEYEDIRIERESWPELKPKTRWGQMPFLNFGQTELAQSAAIGRYLSRKFGLVGSDDLESAKCDEIVDSIADMRGEFRKIIFAPNDEAKVEAKKAFISGCLKNMFTKFAEIKEENGGEWIVGKKVTWADLTLASLIDMYETVLSDTDPDFMAPYPSLKALKNSVFAIPEIKEWVAKRPQTPL